MIKLFAKVTKKSLTLLSLLLISITLAQAAAPSRCDYAKGESGTRPYYNAVNSWHSRWNSTGSSAYWQGLVGDLDYAKMYLKSCGHGTSNKCGKDGGNMCKTLSRDEIATQNRLVAYQEEARILSWRLNKWGTTDSFDLSNCSIYEGPIDFGPLGLAENGRLGYRLKCGNSIYFAFVNCYNGNGWIKFDRNLCTPYTPSCPTSYPYLSLAAAEFDNVCYWNTENKTYFGSCGGSNRTCWKRKTKIAVNGTCPSWSYSTYNAARNYNSCKYNVTSFYGSGAKCGGTNPTCYKRGAIIPVNGTCNIPFSLNNRNRGQYGYTGGINSPYSSGARCTGTNPYCGYTCLKPTCQPLVINGKTINWNILVSANEQIPHPLAALPCDKNSAGLGFATNPSSENSGTVRCFTALSTPDKKMDGLVPNTCHRGPDTHCYQLKTCEEINPAFPHEYSMTGNLPPELRNNLANLIFVPDSAGNAGVKGLRCGKYYPTDAPWWQAMGSNIYAQNKIKAIDKPKFSLSCQNSFNCSPYIIRTANDNGDPSVVSPNMTNDTNTNQANDNCAATAGNTAGLALVKGDFGDITPSQAITNRSNPRTAAYPAFDAASFNPKPNYEYFFGLLGNKADNCRGDIPAAGKICQQASDMTVGDFTASGSHVVFVNGDLNINGEIKVPEGSYLAFIVKGNINIDHRVGNLANNICAKKGDGDIQGVYIADGDININSNPTIYLLEFNGDTRCDKNLVLEGIFASWSEIKFNRTFKGCGPNGDGLTQGQIYPNYNATNPAETIIYRPDLLLNTPTWMKQPKIMRLETI